MIRKNYHIELVEAICKKIDANEFVKEDENTDEYNKYLRLRGKEKRYSWNEIIDVAKRIIEKDNTISDEKIVFLKVVSNIIKSGMNIIGVETPEKM